MKIVVIIIIIIYISLQGHSLVPLSEKNRPGDEANKDNTGRLF